MIASCTWEGGKATLQVSIADDNRIQGLALSVHLGDQARERLLLYTAVSRKIGDTADGAAVHIPGDAIIRTRRDEKEASAQRQMNQTLSTLVRDSALPAESKSRVRLFDIRVPEGTVEPSAAAGLKHAIHLGLFKLDFMDRGPNAQTRGKPLVDVAKRSGLSTKAIEAAVSSFPPALPEEEDERPRQYWAGGIEWGPESKRDEFKNGTFWQIGWPRDTDTAAGQTTWKRFQDVMPGDLFALKGLGGEHDLVIHDVGEVLDVDYAAGRLTYRRLDVPHYHGKGPRDAGAGNWFDTLVPVTRRDVIATIFGRATVDEQDEVQAENYEDIPLNLILYGPPGTGKTYSLQRDYLPRFTRRQKAVREADAAAESAGKLTYFEVLVAALDSLPHKRASVDQLVEHPLVRAKHQVNAINNIRQRAWGTLGHHTVESSKTVNMKRRFGDLVFDKDTEGRWFFAAPVPTELRATLDRALTRSGTLEEVGDYEFVTFHQAYSYEDFIEGIRPSLATEGEDDPSEEKLGYALVDGVFKRAATRALGLMGYSGTIDEFCKLPWKQREALAESGPHYAVFIDEINRGNVARVLGELITLLEDDKRLGRENELIVTLPYSGSRFGVPPNLHIIGTMNTADRSVEALDAALRRRFDFVELGPQPEILKFTIDGPIDPRRLLETINRRLEKLRDRDHRIGHAYLKQLEGDHSIDALKRVFERKIIPLLQEYFFGDWGKIGLVLGEEFVRRRDDSVDFAKFDHDESELLSRRPVFELVPMSELTDRSFRRIYEHVADDA